MKELVRVEKNDSNINVVDARELHGFLEIKSNFRDWIKNYIRDFDFIEGEEYATVDKNLANGGKSKEYAITMDMAKELSMLTRNDKGKEARKYFIKCEQLLKDIALKLGSKKHQLEAMEFLQHLLPEEAKQERINYIKANTIVNKAISNMFGFPKMLKKAEMNAEMLELRDKALDDYIKLFEVIQDNSKIKPVLYEKYKQKAIV